MSTPQGTGSEGYQKSLQGFTICLCTQPHTYTISSTFFRNTSEMRKEKATIQQHFTTISTIHWRQGNNTLSCPGEHSESLACIVTLSFYKTSDTLYINVMKKCTIENTQNRTELSY